MGFSSKLLLLTVYIFIKEKKLFQR